jgi:hypothetical protein
MPRTDILLDENNSILCRDGDIVCGESDQQHVQLLVSSNKGDFKESPTVGAGIIKYVKAAESRLKEMRRDIKVQLNNDGYKFIGFATDENNETTIDYEPNYE